MGRTWVGRVSGKCPKQSQSSLRSLKRVMSLVAPYKREEILEEEDKAEKQMKKKNVQETVEGQEALRSRKGQTSERSQRYPPIARYGVFGVSTWPIGCDTPSPFLSIPPWRACKVEVRYPPPPRKGYLSDTCAIPYENKANGCDTPLCDTISKGYCAIWGGISHWAAKVMRRITLQKPRMAEKSKSLKSRSKVGFLEILKVGQ